MADVLIKFTPTGIDDTGRQMSTLAERIERLGTVGEGANALLSLFQNGQAKVTVSAYDDQAMQQMRDVRGDPLTTSTTVLGDPRGLAYALDRDAERGVLARGI